MWPSGREAVPTVPCPSVHVHLSSVSSHPSSAPPQARLQTLAKKQSGTGPSEQPKPQSNGAPETPGGVGRWGQHLSLRLEGPYWVSPSMQGTHCAQEPVLGRPCPWGMTAGMRRGVHLFLRAGGYPGLATCSGSFTMSARTPKRNWEVHLVSSRNFILNIVIIQFITNLQK